MIHRLLTVLFPALLLAATCSGRPADDLTTSGVSGGIVVHLNCGTGTDTGALLSGDRYLVHGLDTDSAAVQQARDRLTTQGLYGRVSVDLYDGRTLPYGDNVVNLIISDSLGAVPQAEALRVLVPGGVLMVGGSKTVKPWPGGVDDWPMYMNKADNNGVAMDSVVGPPRRMQWLDAPVWARSHMAISTTVAAVTANGRLFTIEDTAPTDNPFLPAAFKIVARDAFNGRRLWERAITRWESITMYIKCLPVQQQRRLAVAGDTLWCTLELEGPVSALNAATGELLRVYEGTSPAQELAVDQGILFVNVGERFPSAAYNIVKTKGRPFEKGVDPSQPFHGAGFREGYAPEVQDKEAPVSTIVAVDTRTGRHLWRTPPLTTYTAASFAVRGPRAVYQTGEGLFCLDVRTGKEIWARRATVVNALGHDSKTPGTTPNTVVLTDDRVFAVRSQPIRKRIPSVAKSTVYAHALKDGRLLWQAPASGNYEASADVFYVNGSLWVGGGGSPIQYDADTGQVVKTLKQVMKGPMSHDRCYRNMITQRYFINSKTGGADFLDLDTGTEFPHHWTRGGCGMGVLPANGLLYATPFSCSCSSGSMIQGMNAYASLPGITRSDDPVPLPRVPRLERGPAYAAVSAVPAGPTDWPVLRRDGMRSGITPAGIEARLTRRWTAELTTRPSAITSAAGKLYVCDVDAHRVYAFDSESGNEVWHFSAGARIDSPPTYHDGVVLFGARDGWLYCLRAEDGALVYRFKDLPDRLICAFGQLESAWPLSGSVLLLDGKAYVAAGRSSFLDGGIVLYCLNPHTGELLNSRVVYGPFAKDTGFPVARKNNSAADGFKNGVLVTDGTRIYLRHRAFEKDLTDAATPEAHIIPLGGFLDPNPQHRTGWIVGTGFNWWQKARDILVTDGTRLIEVEGFPIFHNHSYFDPRRSGYKLIASVPGGSAEGKGGRGGRKRKGARRELWRSNIPITGKAIAMSGDVVFVAGEPMDLTKKTVDAYVAAYDGRLGGRLLAFSAATGERLADHKLPAAPAWDGIAIADGRLFISLTDGTICCFSEP